MMLWALFIPHAIASSTLENPGFELGTDGDVAGWTLQHTGATVRQRLRTRDAPEGERYLSLILENGRVDLQQELEASELAGQRVDIGIKLRRTNPEDEPQGPSAPAGAPAGLRVGANALGGMVYMNTAELDGVGQWTTLSISIDLPDDTTHLIIRPWLRTPGQLDIDDVTLTPLGPAHVADAGPGPVSPEALDRLTAFARLYGAIRVLHPSDGSVDADWDAVALRGTELAENADSMDALSSELTTLFTDIAPTVEIHPSTQAPSPHPALSESGDRLLAYKTLGPGAVDHNPNGSFYQHVRVDTRDEWRATDDQTVHLARLDARPARDDTLRLRAEIRAELAPTAEAVLRLSDGTTSSELALSSGGWRQRELIADIPRSAEDLDIELDIRGQGTVEIRSLELEPVRVPHWLHTLRWVGTLLPSLTIAGSLCTVGVIASRSTLGGIVSTLVAYVFNILLARNSTLMATILPMDQVALINARLMDKAEQIAFLEEKMGGPMDPQVSHLVVLAWVVGLLWTAGWLFRRQDIQGRT